MSYCYWSDKDKSGNAAPTNAVGHMQSGNEKTENQVNKVRLAIFTEENINNTGNNASYSLNQKNSTGAWIQDFKGTNGKYVNDKYPYLVENPPEQRKIKLLLLDEKSISNKSFILCIEKLKYKQLYSKKIT